MIKEIFIIGIVIYQKAFSPILKQILGVSSMCRYSPTCSEYAVLSIREKGVIKGLANSFLRFLSCQPFYNNLKLKPN